MTPKPPAAASMTFVLGPPAASDARGLFDAFQKAWQRDPARAIQEDPWVAMERKVAHTLYGWPAGAGPTPDEALSGIAQEPILVTRYSLEFVECRGLRCASIALNLSAPESVGDDGPLDSPGYCQAVGGLLGAVLVRHWVEWTFVPTSHGPGAAVERGSVDATPGGD